jgi:hydrogenase nickel incorporation protein HypB
VRGVVFVFHPKLHTDMFQCALKVCDNWSLDPETFSDPPPFNTGIPCIEVAWIQYALALCHCRILCGSRYKQCTLETKDMHHIDVRLEKDVYDANNTLADRNARHLKSHNIRAFDLLGAIGSGKTALIERLVPLLEKKGLRAGAIAGDVYGDDDFRRIVALGIPAFNANTGKECHLDAHLVEHAIDHLPLDQIDILFIENVGNMVCPTDFRLGAEKRVVVVSSTEGDDVVNKHPMMFRDCTIGVINKVDLAPLVGANLDRMQNDIARYNPGMPVFRTNLKTGDGVVALLEAILS